MTSRERPILFSDAMAQATYTGRKTQTRRIYKTKNGGIWPNPSDLPGMQQIMRNCPYGQPGDRLWVRESHYIVGEYREVFYRANGGRSLLPPPMQWTGPWNPSIHMPRWASRSLLEITAIWIERLQRISAEDAMAEGIERLEDFFGCPCWKCYGEPAGADVACPDDPIGSYRSLWESINGPGSWGANPWVWVIEFERVEGQP